MNRIAGANSRWLSPIAMALSFVLLGSCDIAGREQYENTTQAIQGNNSTEQEQSSRALQFAEPEQVGMSGERLGRITEAMQELVDDGLLAGVVTMVARHNKIVHFESVGYRDIEAGAPMTNDAIFRIYSMSKPITGAALMMLYDEGKFRLSDPVGKYIPEFSNLQVATGARINGDLATEEPGHRMTIRELMSHTGGLTYGIFSRSIVDGMYNEANVLDSQSTLKNMIDKLSSIPLRQQPGSQFHYSVSADVQGYLVEVLSGQTFEEFLEERLFEPLGMVDAGWHIPPEKIGRFAQVYHYDDSGTLIPKEWELWPRDYYEPATFFSGGAGLVATAMDYMRFSQMVLDGGELDGARVLAPLTLDLMHRDQMPAGVPYTPGLGFGLDFAVVTDPVEADSISTGEFYWGGAAGTWFWIDPVEDLVFVGMIQQFGGARPDVRSLSRRLTYAAIMQPNGI